MTSTTTHLRALADAAPTPLWLDDPAAPAPAPALTGAATADLVVVGGGYTGLWTALRAKEREPARDVVLLEARTCGWAASGRNGGFVASSLTHGFLNGHDRWPDEIRTLERLGVDNLDAIGAAVDTYGIDCAFERTGELDVATQPWQLDDLRARAELETSYGNDVTVLDADATRARVDSPTYLGALWEPHGTALVEPARLAWGLRRACLDLGVRIHENTPVQGLTAGEHTSDVRTPYGRVTARHIALATNAFPSPLRRVRAYVIPVYDYCLATEPLTDAQREAIGWHGREGIADSANQFHYYRLTHDNRIVWGGYDTIYHYANGLRDELNHRPRTYATLARQFFETFPQLEGIRFTHTWGGVIDTSTRFCVFFGSAHGKRLSYAAGFTGLGVGATRFAADTMLDLLHGDDTERTRLRMVRDKPLPFPPEPVRWTGIQLTRRSLDRADRTDGRRNLWLRTLDKCGLGFNV
ncbi:FAD-dependent oxidoreductase [Embleya scabrispora]|uniref:FAD-dependent oxidoreductase n=1 Tax=Embleya scabrispora TaxID=159449 RepID=A0A1T3NLU1_9ACTN|nr:FAD-dependent oxidoreductase [Embleya scabrispora]OPC77859.1 FAD-dependent oxidoreductase [Embleya scabrispora]